MKLIFLSANWQLIKFSNQIKNSWAFVLFSLSIYLALVLNLPILFRRFSQLQQSNSLIEASWQFIAETILVLSCCAFLLILVRTLGIWFFRILVFFILTFSSLSSYYMIFFNVVIGYGVVQAVLTTDIDLSKEAIGFGLLLWFIITMIPGLILLCCYRPIAISLPNVLKKLWKNFLIAVLVFGCGSLSYFSLNRLNKENIKDGSIHIKPSVLVAHTFVPSNWLAGFGMSISNYWTMVKQQREMIDPANLYDYQASAELDDSLLVVVIGESARSDNFGVFGYNRATTPNLSSSKDWVVFSGESCNTSTKLSLQCMFVRPSAVQDNGIKPPKIFERSVFSVFKKLGYNIQLFAMQSEVWFYNSIQADFYKIREVIAAETKNVNQASHDQLLLAEVANAIQQKPKGKRIIVLHTKGSHFLYTARYPREYAIYLPECKNIDAKCSQQQLINSYDNSILYLDNFLNELTKILQQQKALVVYTSDHGESIGENEHFHATPKPLAPREQLNVPLMLWASKTYLQNPILRKHFTNIKTKAENIKLSSNFSKQNQVANENKIGHKNIFDSLLGCMSIHSKNGGINDSLNLCQ